MNRFVFIACLVAWFSLLAFSSVRDHAGLESHAAINIRHVNPSALSPAQLEVLKR